MIIKITKYFLFLSTLQSFNLQHECENFRGKIFNDQELQEVANNFNNNQYTQTFEQNKGENTYRIDIFKLDNFEQDSFQIQFLFTKRTQFFDFFLNIEQCKILDQKYMFLVQKITNFQNLDKQNMQTLQDRDLQQRMTSYKILAQRLYIIKNLGFDIYVANMKNIYVDEQYNMKLSLILPDFQHGVNLGAWKYTNTIDNNLDQMYNFGITLLQLELNKDTFETLQKNDGQNFLKQAIKELKNKIVYKSDSANFLKMDYRWGDFQHDQPNPLQKCLDLVCLIEQCLSKEQQPQFQQVIESLDLLIKNYTTKDEYQHQKHQRLF